MRDPAKVVKANPNALTFTYTNYRGETAERRVNGYSAEFEFKATEWHPEPQWLMSALDLDKNASRDFAVKDIVFGSPAPDRQAGDAGVLRDATADEIERVAEAIWQTIDDNCSWPEWIAYAQRFPNPHQKSIDKTREMARAAIAAIAPGEADAPAPAGNPGLEGAAEMAARSVASTVNVKISDDGPKLARSSGSEEAVAWRWRLKAEFNGEWGPGPWIVSATTPLLPSPSSCEVEPLFPASRLTVLKAALAEAKALIDAIENECSHRESYTTPPPLPDFIRLLHDEFYELQKRDADKQYYQAGDDSVRIRELTAALADRDARLAALSATIETQKREAAEDERDRLYAANSRGLHHPGMANFWATQGAMDTADRTATRAQASAPNEEGDRQALRASRTPTSEPDGGSDA